MTDKIKTVFIVFLFSMSIFYDVCLQAKGLQNSEDCNDSPKCLLNVEWRNHLDLKEKFVKYLDEHPIHINRSKSKRIKNRYILFVKNLEDFLFSSLTFKNENLLVEPFSYFYVKEPWSLNYASTSKLFSVYYHHDDDFMWKNNLINKELEIKFRYFMISEGFKPIANIDYGLLKDLKFTIEWISKEVKMSFKLRNKEYIYVVKKIKDQIEGIRGVYEEEAEYCSNNIGTIRSYSESSGNLLLVKVPYAYIREGTILGYQLEPRIIQILIKEARPMVNFFDLPFEMSDPP